MPPPEPSPAMMTESRLVFPSSSGISDSDTPKDGEGVSWLPHYHTDAYRYCKAPQRSIFITYLRWEIGGMQKEISRKEAIDIWFKAANGCNQIQIAQIGLMEGYPMNKNFSRFVDSKRQGECDRLSRLRSKIAHLHDLVSSFFELLLTIESSGTIHQTWPETDLTPFLRESFSKLFNTSTPEVIKPYHIILELGKVLDGTAKDAGIIPEIGERLSLTFPDIRRPVYQGWEDGQDLEDSQNEAAISEELDRQLGIKRRSSDSERPSNLDPAQETSGPFSGFFSTIKSFIG